MSLSDRIIQDSEQDNILLVGDVKEFIKELIAKGEEYEWEGSEIILELAGEKLTKTTGESK